MYLNLIVLIKRSRRGPPRSELGGIT